MVETEAKLVQAIMLREDAQREATLTKIAHERDAADVTVENRLDTTSDIARVGLEVSNIFSRAYYLQFQSTLPFLTRFKPTALGREERARHRALYETRPIDAYSGLKVLEGHPLFKYENGRMHFGQSFRLMPLSMFLETSRFTIDEYDFSSGLRVVTQDLNIQDIDNPWEAEETGLVDVDIYNEVRVVSDDLGEPERAPRFHARVQSETSELETFWAYGKKGPMPELLAMQPERTLEALGILLASRNYLTNLLPAE